MVETAQGYLNECDTKWLELRTAIIKLVEFGKTAERDRDRYYQQMLDAQAELERHQQAVAKKPTKGTKRRTAVKRPPPKKKTSPRRR